MGMYDNVGLNALLTAMSGMKKTGGANNQPNLEPLTTNGPPSAASTPSADFQPNIADVPTGSGAPRHTQPGVIGALARMQHNQPGTLGTLLGMISKGVTAGHNTYATSYYTSPRAIEKPSVAGMFGDLAMELGQNRSVSDYLQSGNEQHLGLVSPERANVARNTLDRRKAEETRKEERKEDITARDRREAADRAERLGERTTSFFQWRFGLAEDRERYQRIADDNYAWKEWQAIQEMNKKMGGNDQDLLSLIRTNKEYMHLYKLERDMAAKKAAPGTAQARKTQVAVDEKYLLRALEDINSGVPALMAPAMANYNRIIASNPDLQSEWQYGTLVPGPKVTQTVMSGPHKDESIETSTLQPQWSYTAPAGVAVAPEPEQSMEDIERVQREAVEAVDKAYKPVLDQIGGVVKSGGPAPQPAQPTVDNPLPMSPAERRAQPQMDPVINELRDPHAGLATFMNLSRSQGPLQGEETTFTTTDLDGNPVTVTWNEELNQWE